MQFLNHARFRRFLPFIICGLASFFYVYEFFLRVMPSAMTTSLMQDFGIGADGLGLMASLFYFGYTPMQVPAGLMFDVFGPRILLTFAVLVCAISTLLFGLTDNFFLASMARLLMGFASSFAFIGSLVLAARWFPAKYFALIAGLVQLMGCYGAIVGERPVADLVATIGWRPTLYWSAVVGFLLAILFWLFIHDKPGDQAVVKPHDKKKGRLGRNELGRLRQVCSKSQTWWIALYAFSSWAPVTIFAALWGVPFLMTLYHEPAATAAIGVSIVWVSIGFSSPLIGWWSNHIASRRIPMLICSVIALISSCLMLYLPGAPWPLMFVLLLLFGIGPAGQVVSFGAVQDNHPPEVAGTAVGFNNMAVVMGGVVLQPLVGVFLRNAWNGMMHNGVPVYSINDYRLALVTIPIVSLIGIVVSIFFIKETHCVLQYDMHV